jgi:hypothetical protein
MSRGKSLAGTVSFFDAPGETAKELPMLTNRILKWAAAGAMGLGIVPAIGLAHVHVSLPTSAITVTPTGMESPAIQTHVATTHAKTAKVKTASVHHHKSAAKHHVKTASTHAKKAAHASRSAHPAKVTHSKKSSRALKTSAVHHKTTSKSKKLVK